MIPTRCFASLWVRPNFKLASIATVRLLRLYRRVSIVPVGRAVQNVTCIARLEPPGNKRYWPVGVGATVPAVAHAAAPVTVSSGTPPGVPGVTPAEVPVGAPAETPALVPAAPSAVSPNRGEVVTRSTKKLATNEDVPPTVQAPVQPESTSTQQVQSSQRNFKSGATIEEPGCSSPTIADPPSSCGSYRLACTSVDTIRLKQQRESNYFSRYIKAFCFLFLICAHFFLSTLATR
eukprot:GEMP01046228.1.p1 GENE.GEMP01046228.1~~GEMP01046228.1.p1  ORF type:complete len:234 (+),score=33.70 GEMP01046228.1:378-1079(+)